MFELILLMQGREKEIEDINMGQGDRDQIFLWRSYEVYLALCVFKTAQWV